MCLNNIIGKQILFPPESIHDLEKFILNLKASHFGVLSLHEGSFHLHLIYDFYIYEM